MCRAHILRFSCAHGILMAFEPCKLSPCPIIRTSGEKLPQQPYRCYNCQHRRDTKNLQPVFRRTASCSPGSAILDSEGMDEPAALASLGRAQSFPANSVQISHPLPNVARQPLGCVTTGMQKRRPSSARPFKFECQSSGHMLTPHYLGLPSHLPHQDHACPPCQLQKMRERGEEDVIKQARIQYPKLTVEMLIRDGTIKEFQDKPTWDQYIDEKITEEREMWLHVTRKWTQDLKRCRVLVAEEDGLGLFP